MEELDAHVSVMGSRDSQKRVTVGLAKKGGRFSGTCGVFVYIESHCRWVFETSPLLRGGWPA